MPYLERNLSYCNEHFCSAFVLGISLISHLAIFEEGIFKISLQGKESLVAADALPC